MINTAWLVPMHRLDRFDRLQQHPRPEHPQFSDQSALWRGEHTDLVHA